MVEIAYPQQPHAAVVLLLDVSGSMAGRPLELLHEGLNEFLNAIRTDDLASKRVDLAIVTFGQEIQVVHDFAPVTAYDSLQLEAGGPTPLGEALELSVQMLEARKRQYQEEGTEYYRPWLVLLTDGAPTDMRPGDARFARVAELMQTSIANKKLAFFPVGVGPEADLNVLNQLTGGQVEALRLKGLNFSKFFQWLSNSQKQLSRSRVGDRIPLESPRGWAEL